MWENLTEMANAVKVPLDYLLTRGQQVKVHSVILGKARQLGYLIPDNEGIGTPDGKKYEGATVLELAQWGVHDPATMAWLDVPPAATWAQAVGLLDLRGHPRDVLDRAVRRDHHVQVHPEAVLCRRGAARRLL